MLNPHLPMQQQFVSGIDHFLQHPGVNNCNGLEFLVTDRSSFRPVITGIALIQTVAALYPEHTEERLYTTHANPSGVAHLDKLLGIKHAFIKIKNGERMFTEIADEWSLLIQPFLLY